MIIDNWENCLLYTPLIANFDKAIEFAKTLVELPAGRYEADHGIYALVQENVTCDIGESPFECHRNYIDIQWVIDGCESIEWTNKDLLEVESDYQAEKDIELRRGFGQPLHVCKDQFYIMFPQDAHKCCGNVDGKAYHYKKIVLKLLNV